ncbi:hypothetical protein GGX14DRAFT_405824 [Mycena pura]|uniref:Uncharacterized protein n=1 Tax=Mycena pura TaxID=153505 RepID=A0AAD6Y625_9AGAR|nr:hypothetical protein GGX14DRAFT_405824 [Mycena pura]
MSPGARKQMVATITERASNTVSHTHQPPPKSLLRNSPPWSYIRHQTSFQACINPQHLLHRVLSDIRGQSGCHVARRGADGARCGKVSRNIPAWADTRAFARADRHLKDQIHAARPRASRPPPALTRTHAPAVQRQHAPSQQPSPSHRSFTHQDPRILARTPPHAHLPSHGRLSTPTGPRARRTADARSAPTLGGQGAHVRARHRTARPSAHARGARTQRTGRAQGAHARAVESAQRAHGPTRTVDSAPTRDRQRTALTSAYARGARTWRTGERARRAGERARRGRARRAGTAGAARACALTYNEYIRLFRVTPVLPGQPEWAPDMILA